MIFQHLRPWMEIVCGEPLESTGSLFAAQYGLGGECVGLIVSDPSLSPDKLLCHDDKLEGRRVAFNLYLTPANWTAEDGGQLEFYGVNCECVEFELIF